eukprot:jgi/Botrbrau1/17534/Bobra.0529s0004.1
MPKGSCHSGSLPSFNISTDYDCIIRVTMTTRFHDVRREASVKVSLVFDDPDLEKAFRDSVSVTRNAGANMSLIMYAVVYSKFHYQRARDNNSIHLVWWAFNTGVLVGVASLYIVPLWGSPRIMRLQPMLMTVVGVGGNIAVKLIATVSFEGRIIYGSLSKVFPVISSILVASRVSQAFASLGLGLNCTRSSFFFDLALVACLQGLSITWNRPECEIMCMVQPDLHPWFIAVEEVLNNILERHESQSVPVRGCIALRLFMQVTIGGMVPILMAYWREMRERAAFLKSRSVTVTAPTLSSYIRDGLLICSILVMTSGIMSALHMAFPEVNDVPRLLTKGQL